MATYIFEDQNILKSRVLDSSFSETILNTTTTNGILSRKFTVISDPARKPLATIHWNSKSFEMGGTSKSTKTMKSKPNAFFDTHWRRVWQWDPSTPQYNIEYKDHKWTATEISSRTISGTFKSYRSHIIRKSEPATMTFARDVPDMEQLFLMMVFLRMEARRLDTEDNQARDTALSAANNQSSLSGTSA